MISGVVDFISVESHMLVEAEIWTVARTDKGNAVLVRPMGSERAVPIFIGQLEAQSILIGLGNVPMPRPLTHDLMISVFEKAGLTMEKVEITDLKQQTFYAQIILKQGLKRLSIDARPSDALGMAARIKCPVLIAESVVEEAGIAVNLISEGESDAEFPSAKEIEKNQLMTQLEKAVEEEDYEEAARLRDRIKGLS